MTTTVLHVHVTPTSKLDYSYLLVFGTQGAVLWTTYAAFLVAGLDIGRVHSLMFNVVIIFFLALLTSVVDLMLVRE